MRRSSSNARAAVAVALIGMLLAGPATVDARQSATQAASAASLSWRGWESFGGIATSAPAMDRTFYCAVDTWVFGTDGRLWKRFDDVECDYGQGSEQWFHPVSEVELGEPLGGPSVVSRWSPPPVQARTDIFVTAEWGEVLQYTYWVNGPGVWGSVEWAPVNNADDPVTSAAAIASWRINRLDLFARGIDGDLVHTWSDQLFGASLWTPWESLGGVLESQPAVTSWSEGRLDVFVVGTDGAIWHKFYEGSWSGWESLGGIGTSAPAVATPGPGRLELFVRGTDDALWHRSWRDGHWTGWESLGGVLTSAPAAVSPSPGRVDVVAVGSDDTVWHRWANDL